MGASTSDSRRAARRRGAGLAALIAAAAPVPALQEGATRAPGDLRQRAPQELRAKLERLDPAADGWSGEALQARARERLEALGAIWSAGATAEALAPLLDVGFACPWLRPANLEPVHEQGVFRVLRVPEGSDPRPAGAQELAGAEGLARALSQLALPFDGQREARFEIVGAREEGEGLETTVRFTGVGASGEGSVQVNAVWECRWGPGTGTDPSAAAGTMALRAIAVERYEEVHAAATLFSDCSEAAFGAGAVWREQLLPSLGYWRARLDAGLGLSFLGHQGLALGDVDGDELEDVYVCQPGGLPNLLFVRDEDGGAHEVGAAAGLDFLDVTASALLVDLDGDGDRDLAAAVADEILLLANDGAGRFQLAAAHAAPMTMSLSAADFDRDGDLDLYACRYVSPYGDENAPVPYHDANNGQRNVLLRNEGGLRFADATAACGLDVNNRRFSFAAAWEDFDDDGDQDLYVSNDFGRNNLYRNDGPSRDGAGWRFTDVAAAAGVDDVAAGMGVTWGDYDRDGRVDLYVSNMFSRAGSRVTVQRAFRPGDDRTTLAHYRRHARGNTLFWNAGGGRFEDVTLEAGVEMGRWAWGAIFVDLDLDGWLDLFVPNGFATHEGDVELESFFWRQVVSSSPARADGASDDYLAGWHAINSLMRQGCSWNGNERNCAFANAGGGRFADVSAVAGLDQLDDGRAAARIDWDFDGDLDLLVTNRTGPRLRLFCNERPRANGFVALRLVESGGNRDAIGARVSLELAGGAGAPLVATVRAGEGFLAQSSAWLHFGLGHAAPGRAEVRWPDGERQVFEGLARDRFFVLARESGAARGWSPPAPAPLSPSTPVPPLPPPRARVVLAAPVPVPTLRMEPAEGGPASLLGVPPAGAGGTGRPLLVELWSSAGEPCRGELRALAARSGELARAGLEVLALHAGEGPAGAQAGAFLDGLAWPFLRGAATPETVDALDVLHGAILDREQRIPLPAGFLVNARGELVVMYLGGLEVDVLLSDLALCAAAPAELRAAATPFAGRWRAPAATAPFGYLEQRFRWRGLAGEAREYLLGRIDVVQASPADAHVKFGRLLARSGRTGEALAQFRQAVAADPDHFAAHSGLGIVLHRLRRYEEALAAYDEALRIDPEHGQTWYNAGLASLASLDRAGALRASEALARLESPLLKNLERAILAFDRR